jgi:hypothetical protein
MERFMPFCFNKNTQGLLLRLHIKPVCVKEEEFEDTKGIIGIRKSKNRQQNGQKKQVQKDNSNMTCCFGFVNKRV